jgi:hypothetical protein
MLQRKRHAARNAYNSKDLLVSSPEGDRVGSKGVSETNLAMLRSTRAPNPMYEPEKEYVRTK